MATFSQCLNCFNEMRNRYRNFFLSSKICQVPYNSQPAIDHLEDDGRLENIPIQQIYIVNTYVGYLLQFRSII